MDSQGELLLLFIHGCVLTAQLRRSDEREQRDSGKMFGSEFHRFEPNESFCRPVVTDSMQFSAGRKCSTAGKNRVLGGTCSRISADARKRVPPGCAISLFS